jgi:hypothetical protein
MGLLLATRGDADVGVIAKQIEPVTWALEYAAEAQE